jgi:hypothetical protein
MSETRSIYEELRNAYKILVRKTERKKTVRDLDIYGTDLEYYRK